MKTMTAFAAGAQRTRAEVALFEECGLPISPSVARAIAQHWATASSDLLPMAMGMPFEPESALADVEARMNLSGYRAGELSALAAWLRSKVRVAGGAKREALAAKTVGCAAGLDLFSVRDEVISMR
ncbi:hypothetical protein [Nocardia terpenica]|uniref:Uncharacterized protein n=1 Tax=Nocardia terpenica TaxID=455432 RepID=A0A164LC18_9NOCA|nr:hypothetical protein [Nocardia terpenica]KZM72241.1 hypothetical protein AWN90_36820 [Nocardia terpenica]NQE86613.1 hypothetical protein [Nocardia terpenica]